MLDAGTFKMRAGVLELIAGIALCGIDGALGTAMRADHPEDLKKRKNLAKGVKAEVDGNEIAFELDACMEYGKDFIGLSRQIQGAVAETVEAMTGWDVVAVNVNVLGVNAS